MKDKVILYDFWTYSCINCIRTLPYITAWNTKYADQGLLIIGIHSPEFEFEKDFNNVQTAVKQYNISYPVVQDNEMKTWKAFENRYWPRKYITDPEGYIRYDHIGEGGYAETEKIIQELLQERNQLLGLNTASAETLVDLEEHQFTASQTPELYFGYNFAFGRNQLGNSGGFYPDQIVTYYLPEKLARDYFYLEGQWQNFGDRMKLVSENGKITLPYFAKSVNIVAANESVLQILLDGKSITFENAGTDVQDGIVNISGDRLYNLISSRNAGTHTLTIIAKPGFEIYTFTFG
jgi:thiol-disulfide isomerase/thioredoxin